MAEIFAPFEANGPWPLDKRQVFATKATMKAFDTEHLPDTYFAVCNEDHKLYIYSVDNDEDETTGKWRAFSGGSGSAVITDTFTSNITVGGIDSGTKIEAGTDISDVIKNMLLKYIKPTISLTLDPSTSLYYYGQTISSEKLTAKVTTNSGKITKITLKRGTTELASEESESGVTTATTTDSTTINDTITYYAIGSGTDDISTSKTITFCNPTFAGTVASTVTAPTETDITGLAKKFANNTKGYTYSGITMTYGKILYAYPKSFGALTSITDGVNSYLNSYTRSEVAVTINGKTVDYYAYLLTDAAGVTNFKQIYA